VASASDTLTPADARLRWWTVGDTAFVGRGTGLLTSNLSYDYYFKKGASYEHPAVEDTFGLVPDGLRFWLDHELVTWEASPETTSFAPDSSGYYDAWSHTDVAKKPTWYNDGWRFTRGGNAFSSTYFTADSLCSEMQGVDPHFYFVCVLKFDSSLTQYPYGNFFPLMSFGEYANPASPTTYSTTLQVGFMNSSSGAPDWRIYYYQRPDDTTNAAKTTVMFYDMAADSTALKSGWHVLSVVRSQDSTYVFLDDVQKYVSHGAGRSNFYQLNTFTINGSRSHPTSLTSSNEGGAFSIKTYGFYPEPDGIVDHNIVWRNINRLLSRPDVP
jgi:hypothetical protein